MSTKNARRRTVDAANQPRRRAVAEASPVEIPKEEAAEQYSDLVKALVPKNYELVIDHHHSVKYQAGVVEMPEEHFNHWWSKANGVTAA